MRRIIVAALMVAATVFFGACGTPEGTPEGTLEGGTPDDAGKKPTAVSERNVACGEDLDAVVNADPAETPTTFRLGACRYPVSETLRPQNGDSLVGVAGRVVSLPEGGTRAGELKTKIVGEGLPQVLKPRGKFRAEWIYVTGSTFTGKAGTGVGIAMGNAADSSVVKTSRFTSNPGAGVSNARGTYADVQADHNGSPETAGFIAAGIKGIRAFTVSGGFYHHNQGNGIWCDIGCKESAEHPNFDVHLANVSDNTRAGIRYEHSFGGAIIKENYIARNSFEAVRGGVSIADSRDAWITNNTFKGNAEMVAARATDSGREDRTDLESVTFRDNQLNGEQIVGCQRAEVSCEGEAAELLEDIWARWRRIFSWPP